MQKKLTVLFAFAIFVLIVGLPIMPVTTTLADPNCERHPDNPNCGGGVGAFEAGVTDGAFKFGPVDVTPNAHENSLQRLGGDLILERPPDTELSNQEAWDSVFDVCANLLGVGTIVPKFQVFDPKWDIENAGGVRVIFNNILFGDNGIPVIDDDRTPFAQVTVQLIGDCFPDGTEECDPFLPDDGTSTIILTHFGIHGRTVKGVHPREGCQPPGGGSFDILPLDPPSTLVITDTTS